jgi:predicted  nucleic acid-binding Zn-ribbon protein
MSLVAATQRLIKYSQDLAAQNATLNQTIAYNQAEIADLKQQLANAMANDASDADAIKAAQADADVAKAVATQAQTNADAASAKVVELQAQIQADAEKVSELETKVSELEAQIETAALIDAALNGGTAPVEVDHVDVTQLVEAAVPTTTEPVVEPIALG